MYVKTNARGNIVEATDAYQDNGYIDVHGTVAANMPDGLLGLNGRVFTPNYSLVDGAVVARSAEEKARDPYSDAPQDPLAKLAAENILLKAQVQALADRGEFIEDCIAEMAMMVYE